jgi:hypothetical protein
MTMTKLLVVIQSKFITAFVIVFEADNNDDDEKEEAVGCH